MTAFFMSVFLMQCSDDSASIKALEGIWSTSDKAYMGEYIDISCDTIIMGIKDKEEHAYSIVKVDTEKGHLYNSLRCRIYANDESGVQNMFTFLYLSNDGGTLMNKSSQDILWKRSQ